MIMKQTILRILGIAAIAVVPSAAFASPVLPVHSLFAAEVSALTPCLEPLSAYGAAEHAWTEEVGDVRMTVQGKLVKLQNAQGEILEVFDVTGKKVLSVRIDSADKTISLNLRKGCYILRVAKQTRKISIA